MLCLFACGFSVSVFVFVMVAEILRPDYLYEDKLACELQARGIPASVCNVAALVPVFRTLHEEHINVRICMNTNLLTEVVSICSCRFAVPI
jgi:hypothetical protein